MFGRPGCCRCHRKRNAEKDCKSKRDLSHREQYLKSSTLTSTDQGGGKRWRAWGVVQLRCLAKQLLQKTVSPLSKPARGVKIWRGVNLIGGRDDQHNERDSQHALRRRGFARRRGAGCCLRTCRKQIVGGTCGFLYALILLRIGHLPNLPPRINSVYMSGAGYSRPLYYFTKKTASDCEEALEKKSGPRFAAIGDQYTRHR